MCVMPVCLLVLVLVLVFVFVFVFVFVCRYEQDLAPHYDNLYILMIWPNYSYGYVCVVRVVCAVVFVQSFIAVAGRKGEGAMNLCRCCGTTQRLIQSFYPPTRHLSCRFVRWWNILWPPWSSRYHF
jgi:hypothetical protein